MFVAGHSNAVAVVTDWRLRTDRELDANEGGSHVLELCRPGRDALGKRWLGACRIALFDHGDKPSNACAALRRQRFARWVDEAAPTRLYVIPTADATMGGEQAALKGTHCWQALHAPDTLDAMRGTRWRYNDRTEVIACFPIAKRVKELQRWCMAQWLRAYAMPTLRVRDDLTSITPDAAMLDLMHGMRGKPLAVDLEFNPATDIVTAIGLSDGERAVSVPWDAYNPRNSERRERGIAEFGSIGSRIVDCLHDLLGSHTVKIAHNFVADIPRLTRRGFAVNGTLHDTFAAHAIAFPELRHGLQHAAASLLPVPPWKSLYRPQRLIRGITRDDAEYWIADPQALRHYNCRDAFYTWHLARACLPFVGKTLLDLP